jgi:hypothetical protein
VFFGRVDFVTVKAAYTYEKWSNGVG